MLTDIQKSLFELQDIKYRDFQSSLIPNISKDVFIGVRTPDLKKLAKDLYNTDRSRSFLYDLPHKYFDENQLHSFLISLEYDFSKCIKETERFLPYIDNWATCDQLSPKCFRKESDKLIPYIEKWLNSENIYEVRFGIISSMRYFLDEKFELKYAEAVAKIDTDEYYINMASAWYFATALAKQYDKVLSFISENRLSDWVRKKSIQKAIESYRIPDERKEDLRKYR